MAFQSIIAGTQIDGARDYQEDAFLITNLSDAHGDPSALVIVADGMGGHAAGNVASNMAVQAFNKYVTTEYPSDDLATTLNESLLRANGAITETVKETPALEGMGCTMIGLVVEGNHVWWVSVGDSHLYLLRDRKLTKLNADHSYGGFLDRMEAAGTPVEAEPGLSRNMLMSAVTGADIAEIDCPPTPITLEHDDKLIVCSDGLDTLSEGKIIQYSDWSDTPKECAEALMEAVEEAAMPRQDNTTAVVIKIIDSSMAETAVVEEKDDDDEDITAPGDDTTAESEMSLDSDQTDTDQDELIELTADGLETAEAPADTPQVTDVVDDTPETAPAQQPPEIGEEEKPKSKAGLIIGIVVAVLIMLGVGGYMVISSLKSKVESVSEEFEKATVDFGKDFTKEMQKTMEEAAKEQEKSTPATTDEAQEEATTDEVSKEAPVPTTKVEPTTIPEATFQDPLKSGGKGPVMVVIPAGSFEMGSPSSSSRFRNERPRHTVKVKSFAISKYEVTFDEYDKFANATKRKLPNDLYMDRKTHPVIFVEWDDAYYYVKWLSEQTGKKYRLPSESEWEYAASTGAKSVFWWGHNEEIGKAHCFTCKSGLDPRKPSKVGSFEANKFGLHDTAGNVAEWVKDCWHGDYKGAPVDGEVWEGGNCTFRAVRGGAYISPQQSIRSAKRDKLKSDAEYDHVGIRIARELD